MGVHKLSKVPEEQRKPTCRASFPSHSNYYFILLFYIIIIIIIIIIIVIVTFFHVRAFEGLTLTFV